MQLQAKASNTISGCWRIVREHTSMWSRLHGNLLLVPDCSGAWMSDDRWNGVLCCINIALLFLFWVMFTTIVATLQCCFVLFCVAFVLSVTTIILIVLNKNNSAMLIQQSTQFHQVYVWLATHCSPQNGLHYTHIPHLASLVPRLLPMQRSLGTRLNLACIAKFC